MNLEELDSRAEAQARIEEVQIESDYFGSASWWTLPMKEKFVGKRLELLETHQREVFMKKYLFKSEELALDEFAHFFTELMNDEVKSMLVYSQTNKLERRPIRARTEEP